jgi:hypothetical protein
MKRLARALALGTLGASLTACGGEQADPAVPIGTVLPSATAAPSATLVPSASASASAEAGTVKLSPLEKTDVTVKVGTKLTWGFHSHASVGFGASQAIEGAGVLAFVREDRDYERPKEQREGQRGADSARSTYVFEAVGKGKAKLVLSELFRGTVKQTYTFHVTVE